MRVSNRAWKGGQVGQLNQHLASSENGQIVKSSDTSSSCCTGSYNGNEGLNCPSSGIRASLAPFSFRLISATTMLTLSLHSISSLQRAEGQVSDRLHLRIRVSHHGGPRPLSPLAVDKSTDSSAT